MRYRVTVIAETFEAALEIADAIEHCQSGALSPSKSIEPIVNVNIEPAAAR